MTSRSLGGLLGSLPQVRQVASPRAVAGVCFTGLLMLGVPLMGRFLSGRHPWAEYRRKAGLTQLEVAEFLGVTRHYIIRLEQGLYWHPTDSLLVKLAIKYGVDFDEFEMAYYDYVRQRRELFKTTHKTFEEGLVLPYRLVMHPLVSWRQSYGYSRMRLCKELCLHYDNVSDYELNQQRNVPEQLAVACDEMGWLVEPLEHAVSDWRTNGYADKLRASRR